jgi:hypothetical protein
MGAPADRLRSPRDRRDAQPAAQTAAQTAAQYMGPYCTIVTLKHCQECAAVIIIAPLAVK